MREEKLVSELALAEGTRLVLLVMDGLGGLPHPDTGLTELETASTPNLDALAARSACGLIHPVAPGVTPGSGPGHLSLFGYDPQEHEIGRGILSALGLGLEVGPGDVAARVNFCTVSGRRGHRPPGGPHLHRWSTGRCAPSSGRRWRCPA